MTTTVTVKTHDWPVAVRSSGGHTFNDPHQRRSGYNDTEAFQPAHSEQSYSVTDTMQVSVRELHRDATSLDHHDQLTNTYPGEPATASPVKGRTLDENYQLSDPAEGEDKA